jgi:glycosyltransferase involved in cell wall biosynthesis
VIRLCSIPDPSATANPYLRILYGEAGRRFEVVPPCGISFRWALANRGRLDVFHVHWPHYEYVREGRIATLRAAARFLVFLLLLKTGGTRIVYTLHNLRPHATRYARIEGWVRRRFVRRIADLVLTNFEGSRADLAAVYGRTRRVVCVPHPTYRGFYADMVSRAEARARLGIATEAFVYLCFGGIARYKGIEAAMGAFAREGRPMDRLVVAGTPLDDAYVASLRARAAADGRVRLDARHVPDDEVQVFFRAADCLVAAYPRIYCSGSLMLAMTFGLPVVMPRMAMVAEVAEPEFSALFDPGDEGGVAKAFRAVRALDADAARAAIARAAPRYDPEKIAALFADTLEGIARR